MMGLPGICNPNFILLDFQGGEMFKFLLILYPVSTLIYNLPERNQAKFSLTFQWFSCLW